jgi:hypothetical protein
MIRFSLRCDQDHSFESWFQSADGFDKLKAAGMVACTICGSTAVEKALMAPVVRAQSGETDSGSKPAPLSAPKTEVEQAIAALRKHLEANSDYVGMNFAAEARAMHEGATPERAIHGEAKAEDARALIEEGIPVAPLPFLPPRKTN